MGRWLPALQMQKPLTVMHCFAWFSSSSSWLFSCLSASLGCNFLVPSSIFNHGNLKNLTPNKSSDGELNIQTLTKLKNPSLKGICKDNETMSRLQTLIIIPFLVLPVLVPSIWSLESKMQLCSHCLIRRFNSSFCN